MARERPLRLFATASVGLLVAVGAVVSAAPATGARSGAHAVLSFDGLAGGRVGMNPTQLATRWHVPVNLEASGAGSATCGTADVHFRGAKLTAWFIDGKLARVDGRSGVTTTSGVTVGTSVARLQAVYGGRLVRHQHPYAVPTAYDWYLPPERIPLLLSLERARRTDLLRQ